MEKTHDERYDYRGFWTDGGVCHLQIYQAAGQTPVVVCTQLPENQTTGITNMVEVLAAEVIRAFLPDRFEGIDAPAVVWIEHYPTLEVPGQPDRRPFSRVDFATQRPQTVLLGGVPRLTLGEPRWTHLTRAEVAALLGVAPETIGPPRQRAWWE